MRVVKIVFLALIGLVLLTLSLANLQQVTLRLLPQDLAEFLGVGYSITMPLFLVILGGLLAGLLVGFVWEWLREHRHRAEAARARAEAERLEAQLGQTARTAKGEADDVLALLEDGTAAR